VARGYDATEYTLACFGGAGGQHACLVADALGIGRIHISPLAGVLSAYGMGLADTRALKQRAVEATLDDESARRLDEIVRDLTDAGRRDVQRHGIPDSRIRSETRAHLKYRGTDTALAVAYGTPTELAARFEQLYRQRFAFTMPDVALVVESIEVEVIGASEAIATNVPLPMEPTARSLSAVRVSETAMANGIRSTPYYDRATLPARQHVDGPAVIFDATSTTVVEPGWSALQTDRGDLLLQRVQPRRHAASSTELDPVRLEMFNNAFMSVAEQMGLALQNTAYSVNIKERLDFSCAVFEADGTLIANAPHMPVHLGSMGESVRAALQAKPRQGDVIALNNPYHGGTHLPDVTVVMPVFDAAGERVLFVVAARGHHADIGGSTPGSMPSNSRTLDDEGVLIDNFLLVSQGRFRDAEFRSLLSSGRFPARNPDQNVGDIKAQVAACARGAEELQKLMKSAGVDTVLAYMGHVRRNAEESVRRMLANLPDGHFRYEMDDGAAVEVSIKVDHGSGRATVDFTGTSAQQPTNFNAPASICRAATLYVIRTLLDDDIPMNDGCLAPIDLVIPRGSMLRPEYPAAVVAGNVETSQVVTDALYGATGRLAAAQGTMNNFTFGNAEYQYYETICGGSGAGPGFDGTSAVHTHMTNSRLTDPEVLEWRFPVLVESFQVRKGSGGAGRWRGGDGVIRRIRFREHMTASLLANRRRVPPFGLDGGAPAAVGTARVERATGEVVALGPTAEIEVDAGDVFVIETPGGGGFGKARPV
jgi:5-oxoprolinase (ATP-hydrolysing)